MEHEVYAEWALLLVDDLSDLQQLIRLGTKTTTYFRCRGVGNNFVCILISVTLHCWENRYDDSDITNYFIQLLKSFVWNEYTSYTNRERISRVLLLFLDGSCPKLFSIFRLELSSLAQLIGYGEATEAQRFVFLQTLVSSNLTAILNFHSAFFFSILYNRK